MENYFTTAIKNIEFRFDVKLSNILEMKVDTKSIGALGYLIDGDIFLVSPNRSQFSCRNIPNGKNIGKLVEIKGNIHDRKFCKFIDLNIPAIVIDKNNNMYFNAEPFSNFQKWLQFETPITPYLNWYDRMFWLDEFASNLLRLIEKFTPQNIRYLYSIENRINYVILRHDVDNSRDLTYLKFEEENNIPATYSLLLDKNLGYWINNIKDKDLFEVSFHFNSNHIGIKEYIKMFFNKILNTKFWIENKPINWKKNPLSRQIKKFIKKTGLKPYTLHRHYSFIQLPEFINQLELIKNKYPFILGDSSFFRATVLFEKSKCANGLSYGYYHYEPDVGSPFWWVFKLYNPVSKKVVHIWEQSHIMEPDESIIDYIFNKRVYGVRKNLFTIGLYPAHARTNTFHPKGQIEVLKYLLSIKDKYNIKFITYKSFLEDIENED